ncbi:unnamed protein product [Macrosiphum euphorbiae]|uniref:BED-type domain-containing protein n=1 Tax=Macrosiphum euphorbiae TaxID=13131 RepID=A0AAV0XW49_9HEMI|nr:unnamed protein product [Macrosiphum euphorbiae]
MSRETSDIWHNFKTVSSETAKCYYCSVSYSFRGGSTANLSRHLKRKHIIQYEVRKNVHTEITHDLDLEDNIDEPNPISVQQNTETQNQPSTSSSLTSKITNTPLKTSQSQTLIDSFIPRPLPMNKSQKIDEQ